MEICGEIWDNAIHASKSVEHASSIVYTSPPTTTCRQREERDTGRCSDEVSDVSIAVNPARTRLIHKVRIATARVRKSRGNQFAKVATKVIDVAGSIAGMNVDAVAVCPFSHGHGIFGHGSFEWQGAVGGCAHFVGAG